MKSALPLNPIVAPFVMVKMNKKNVDLSRKKRVYHDAPPQ